MYQTMTGSDGPMRVINDINVNHPTHYNSHAKECIVEMLVLFGLDDFITFCKMNAWKYRYRAGNKANNSADQDNAKADRYIEYADRAEAIVSLGLGREVLTDDEFFKHIDLSDLRRSTSM